MKKLLVTAALFAFVLGAGPAAKKLPDKPLPTEETFVMNVTKDLNAKYATPADAEKAGYFRYTNEDYTGAISYANLNWNSATDPNNPQPSQLWYDVNGKLLGADYSVPLTSANAAKPPQLWGLAPGRWMKFSHAHVHYILKDDKGGMTYGKAVSAKAYTGAGGTLDNPTAAPIVKLKKASSADNVAKVFDFPAQWDVELWVTPNPLGAFAAKNPNVHPTKNAEPEEM